MFPFNVDLLCFLSEVTMASSAATPLPRLTQAPDEPVCEWTDEELEAMGDESMADPGESIDGEIVFKNLREELHRRAQAL